MSHHSVHSTPLPNIARSSEDDAYYSTQDSSSSRKTLAVPPNFLRPSRSRSNFLSKQSGVSSLPNSPVTSSFSHRPDLHRAATSTAVSTISTTESTRFDELHYSQTHFSRSTLLVYPDSDSTARPGEKEAEEDIRELLLASSDEESSAPPSTPGFDSSKIPPRGSSVTIAQRKQSMESEKSTLALPEPISLLTPPAAQTSQKKRTGILMKMIPFTREAPSVAQFTAHRAPRFGTFPRVRAETEEKVEALAEHFSKLNADPLSPPLSISSYVSTGSTPETSPELLLLDLPTGHGSGGYSQRHKSASSRESIRTFFPAPSLPRLISRPGSQSRESGRINSSNPMSHGSHPKLSSPTKESEWKKTLNYAAGRASWQSSISHRPRKQQAAASISFSRSTTASGNQSTWPRISNPIHRHNTLLLEHMFVDAGDDGQLGQYTTSSLSAFASENDGPCSLMRCSADSRQEYSRRSSVAIASKASTSSPVEWPQVNSCPGRFSAMPSVKPRRPSTTGSWMRCESAQFGFKTALQRAASSAVECTHVVIGTASLGRAASLRKRTIPNAASIWQKGGRRSSGVGVAAATATATGAFSTSGVTSMMPTIPQGHTRYSSLADTIGDDGDEHGSMPWLGLDPYAQDRADTLARYSISQLSDGLTSDAGLGEFVPFRFYTRRESKDDIAQLDLARRRSSNESDAGQGPVFNLDPFRRSSASRRPSWPRGVVSYEGYHRMFTRPDVPEAVTGSEAEDADADADENQTQTYLNGDGWCRRRSTFSTVFLRPLELFQ